MARHSEEAARRLTAERGRARGRSRADRRLRSAGRSRRAEAGALTEITRSLLRDARSAEAAEPWRRTLDGGR